MSAETDLENALAGGSPRHRPVAGDTDYLDRPTVDTLRRLVRTAGVQGGPAKVYLARRFRYYLGAGMAPTPPSSLRGGVGDWLDRRAWEELEAHADRLPPLNESRRPRS